MDEVLAIFNSATEAVKKYTPSISWDPNVSYGPDHLESKMSIILGKKI